MLLGVAAVAKDGVEVERELRLERGKVLGKKVDQSGFIKTRASLVIER